MMCVQHNNNAWQKEQVLREERKKSQEKGRVVRIRNRWGVGGQTHPPSPDLLRLDHSQVLRLDLVGSLDLAT